jgi:hypothetical protein
MTAQIQLVYGAALSHWHDLKGLRLQRIQIKDPANLLSDNVANSEKRTVGTANAPFVEAIYHAA